MTTWNRRLQRHHRRRNLIQSLTLLLGMVALLSLVGWTIAGTEGILWAAMAGGLSLALAPRMSPRLLLRLYRGARLSDRDVPDLYRALAAISRRAGLPAVPVLHYIPSAAMNAFAVGRPGDAAIAVTDGMLRRLSFRELVAVLAHEVSHIRNNDLWVMGLADVISRITRVMSMFGVLLLVFSLPLLIQSPGDVPLLLVLLLVLAPTLGSLLQLALSRTREFDADADAAWLSGDPTGLASALAKIERVQGRFWEDLLPGGRRIPDPSLLRTHPDTAERIRRLQSMQPAEEAVRSSQAITLPSHLGTADARPRWHASGLWY